MAKVLVVGGAGYVGSAACAWLLDRGHQVHVLDDLSTGHRELVLCEGFTLCRAGDRERVRELLKRERFDCVMHYAASSLVGESVRLRDRYFENNVEQTRALVEELLQADIRRFIFSSSCAIYGDPGDQPINEQLPFDPINPYGESKLAAERLLQDFARTRGLRAIALRYFNAAGAEPGNRVGEWHANETHLIPNVLKAALDGGTIDIFGDDYPTTDGTCVRDYVHVDDLAAAHEAAMNRLLNSGDSGTAGSFEAYNLGTEHGCSVQELIEACERDLGLRVTKRHQPRRPGDPPRLVADSRLAAKTLGFRPAEDSLRRILTSALAWEKKLREPRPAVFLDRDGTINPDPGYINDPSLIRLYDGAGEGLARLKKAGYALVVVTNQSGVARGLVDASKLPAVNGRINELLRPFGVKIDHFEMCFHHPDERCDCRKPLPGMIFNSARALNLDISRSFTVGDKPSDIECGRAANCKGVALTRTGNGAATEKKYSEAPENSARPDFIGDSLKEVADWILESAGF